MRAAVTDDNKRSNCVKVCFTDRQYIDLNRAAAREGRSKADMVYWLALRGMYGIVNPAGLDDVGTRSPSDAPR